LDQLVDELVIVGIAASAGGLEATSLLAQNLPKDLNCAYVIAQHMSPSHKSMLVPLLSRETRLKVEEIEEETVPRAGTIYVPPPGRDTVLEDGLLRLKEPTGHHAMPKPSADRLLKSLAEGRGASAVGVVLSGTGSDGSYGVQAIREAGGITIAQNPDSSKYDSMPVSAIRTGCVDLTLTPEQIGQHLVTVLKRPRDLSVLKELDEASPKNNDLFQILLAHTLVDFRHYKETTINRRIHRRMFAKGIESFDEYVELCRRSVDEVEALYRDLLISVTRFFRDHEQFAALELEIESRFSNRTDDEPIRIWIPGCATGEEAYSIAILVAEALGGIDKVSKDQLQVFATDIDDHALSIGRKATYPASAATDIPGRFLETYFEVSEDTVKVRDKLRQLVMFTRHNVFQDAPFMSIDLVSIRNVLIYFEAKLQERVLARIQYSLKSDGMLFLGTSETTGVLESYFVPIEANSKIFSKRSLRLSRPAGPERALPAGLNYHSGGAVGFHRAALNHEDAWRFDALARSVVETGVLTNKEKSILKIYGDIAEFVEMREPIQGSMTLNVLKKMLSYEAGSMVLVAIRHREVRAGQWHQVDGRGYNNLRMVAYPIMPAADDTESEPLVLIGFETEMREEPTGADAERTDYLDYLETELARTRDTLQVTIEQLQTSNEELQSLNEELQSSNEELQSTNEELETSNEELQSTNEELITVNEELLVNTSQLERATAELNGLISGIPTVMMMLDLGLLIRHASKSAIETFRIRERGHSLGHLSQCYMPRGYPPLVDICSQALLDRQVHQRSIEIGNSLVSLTVTPLTTEGEGLIGLIVLADEVDLTITSELNQTLRAFGNIGTWKINLATGEQDWSPETYAIHGLPFGDQSGKIGDGVNYYHPDDQAMVKEAIDTAIETGEPFHFFARLNRADGRTIVVETSGTAITNEAGEAVALLGVFRDYSRAVNDDLIVKHYGKVAGDRGIGFYSYDIANGVAYWNPTLYEILGIDPAEPASFDKALERFDPEARPRIKAMMQDAIDKNEPFDLVDQITRPDGTRAKCRSTGRTTVDASGNPTHLYGSFQILS
tara:strand:+ start:769 stop:3981 length:3213 start_codon:yes stop_codon:yes gene_type:complete